MLVIGMITCSRPNVDVHNAIEQVRRGGFHETLHLFCEPGTPEIRPLPEIVVHRNERKMGGLGNWTHCLEWLVANSNTEYVLMCEDDVSYCRRARAAWEQSLGDLKEVGFWSLYTPRRDRGLVGHTPGWVASNRGRDTWGTQVMCFPRASAERLVKYEPLLYEDRFRGPADAIVGQCFVEARLPCYYHNPSLADHLGRVSAIGNNWQEEHVGLDFDAEF